MKFAEFLNESTIPKWTTLNRKEITKKEHDERVQEMKDVAGRHVGDNVWNSDGITGSQSYVNAKYKLKTVEAQYHSETKQHKYYVFE